MVFLSTLAITATLLYMSSNYEVWRIHQVLSGNLGTEEGVDALLENLPQVGEGRMKVYNKRSWGYNDDDSLFMGGYQQWHVIKYDSTSNDTSALIVDSQ
jgi:hypothetical protein